MGAGELTVGPAAVVTSCLGDLTMASDPPADAPRTGDPTPPSESPASVGTNRRRKPQGDRFAGSSTRIRGCEIRAVRNMAVSLARDCRAPKSHSRGQGFDPPWLHRKTKGSRS